MRLVFLLFCAIYILRAEFALASAWILPQGKTQLILQNWNTHSNLHGTRYGGDEVDMYLNTAALNLYLEHGLSNKISAGVTSNSSWKMVDDQLTNRNTSHKSWDNLDFFLKTNIIRNDFMIFTWQNLISLPMYQKYALHYTQSEYKPSNAYETRMMLGFGGGNSGIVSGILGGDGSFLNFEIGYRKYESFMNYNELRAQIDLGLKINDPQIKMLLLQFFKTNKIYNKFYEKPASGASNDASIGIPYTNGYKHNDVNQFLGSFLIDIGSNTLVQFGVFYEISSGLLGKSEEGNKARGFVLGLWL